MFFFEGGTHSVFQKNYLLNLSLCLSLSKINKLTNHVHSFLPLTLPLANNPPKNPPLSAPPTENKYFNTQKFFAISLSEPLQILLLVILSYLPPFFMIFCYKKSFEKKIFFCMKISLSGKIVDSRKSTFWAYLNLQRPVVFGFEQLISVRIDRVESIFDFCPPQPFNLPRPAEFRRSFFHFLTLSRSADQSLHFFCKPSMTILQAI